MASLNPPVCDFGWKAPDFRLPGVDGRQWSLAEVSGPKGLLVMFICNHCPYVKTIRERLVADLRELKVLGVHAVGISSNDTVNYPEDSFDNMKQVAAEFDFPFPYLFDQTQEVAKAYGAKYAGWGLTVGEGVMLGEGGDTLVFEIVPVKAFGFGKGEPFSQTRWDF